MGYLLFRLYGPLASWGDIAVGESRHSFNGPTKAAVMGLVGAALGIRREEESQHLALNQHYTMATAVLNPGQLLRDYHTVQAPDSVGKFHYRTRRDELVVGKERLGTILSSREYRTDALAWVALKADENAPFSLGQLVSALKEPVFILYLGRKSCPLSAPLDPQIIQADGFSQAFSRYQPRGFSQLQEKAPDLQQSYLCEQQSVEYCWEGSLDCFMDKEKMDRARMMTLVQHDQLRSRVRWQFSPRRIHRYRSGEGL
jgi:CRISPR system Cascade subunit CasD